MKFQKHYLKNVRQFWKYKIFFIACEKLLEFWTFFWKICFFKSQTVKKMWNELKNSKLKKNAKGNWICAKNRKHEHYFNFWTIYEMREHFLNLWTKFWKRGTKIETLCFWTYEKYFQNIKIILVSEQILKIWTFFLLILNILNFQNILIILKILLIGKYFFLNFRMIFQKSENIFRICDFFVTVLS